VPLDLDAITDPSGYIRCVRELAVMVCWSNCKGDYKCKIPKIFFIATSDVSYFGAIITLKSCEDFYDNIWYPYEVAPKQRGYHWV